MNYLTRMIIGSVLLFVAQSGLACEYPERIKVPNGSTASKEEMLDGQRGVKKYVAEMEVYLECLLEEEKVSRSGMDDLTPEVEQQREEMLNKKYNAAVEEMERIAAQFNAEVQAYRAKDNS